MKTVPIVIGGIVGLAGIVTLLAAAQYKSYSVIFVGLALLVIALAVILAASANRRGKVARDKESNPPTSTAGNALVRKITPAILGGLGLVVAVIYFFVASGHPTSQNWVIEGAAILLFVAGLLSLIFLNRPRRT